MSGCYTVRDVLGSPARVQMSLGVFGMPASGAEGRDSVARVRRMAVRAVAPAGCIVCYSWLVSE